MQIGKALEQAKIDPTEVEIFLSHLLGKDRSFIRAYQELNLDESQTAKLKEFIKRRLKSEPLAYILGYSEFCGLKFKVDQRVMVPRPETEQLVNMVLSHVFASPNRNRKNHWPVDQLKIVDVGTGSGNIAVSLAKAIPFAKIFAIEKDSQALNLAKENIALHNVASQIELISGDLLEDFNEQVDIIVANLPYIPKSRFSLLQREVSQWEPRIALEGGTDGLEIYRKLFIQAPKTLKQNGLLIYELDGEIYTHSYNLRPVVVF